MIPRGELMILYRIAKQQHLLSHRELDVLFHWSQGWGIVNTSVVLGVSESTIRTHRRRITRKLERAIENGALDDVRPVAEARI